MDGAAEATPLPGPVPSILTRLLVLLRPAGWSTEGRDVAAPFGYDQGCSTMFVDDAGVFPEPLRGCRAQNQGFLKMFMIFGL